MNCELWSRSRVARAVWTYDDVLLYSGGSDLRRCDVSFGATTVRGGDVSIEMIHRGIVNKRLSCSDLPMRLGIATILCL